MTPGSRRRVDEGAGAAAKHAARHPLHDERGTRLLRMPLEESRKRDPTDGRLTRHLLAGENSRAVLRLARGVIEAAVPTPLVTSFRRAATLDPSREPTSPTAAPVPAVPRLPVRQRPPPP